MNDTRPVMNHTDKDSNLRELTAAELAAVGGACYQYCPAPLPGLYVDEVITQGQRVPVPS